MKKMLTRVIACILAVFTIFSLASCRNKKAEEILNLLIVQEANGVVSEDFKVISEIARGEEIYQISWTSDSANLVVSETVNDDKTYTIKVVRPESTQVTAKLTAKIDKATKEFEFKVNPYDVYDFSAGFNFKYDKGNVAGQIELPTSYTLEGTEKSCEISWAAADPSLITVNGNVAVVPYTYNKIQTKLIATFTYGSETTTKAYTVYIFDQLVYVAETQIVENQPYYLGFLQKNKDNTYYFVTGEQDGQYGKSTEKLEEAAQFYVEKANENGGFYIYFNNGTDKYYVNGDDKTAGKLYVDVTSKEAKTVWTWNTKYNTFTTEANGDTFYMGTYNSYTTLSCSVISYADTSFVSQWYKEGVMDSNVPTYTEADKLQCEYLSFDIENQTAGELELPLVGKKFDTVEISYEVKEDAYQTIVLNENVLTINNVKSNTEVTITVTFTLGEETLTKDVTFKVRPIAAPTEIPAVVEEIDTTKQYYYGFTNENVGSTVFFSGTMSGYYGATTENADEAVKVSVVAVEGGYHLTFVDAAGVTQYINATQSGEHLNFTFADTASSVWVWVADKATFKTTLSENEIYIGTYSNYLTVSAGKVDKITFPAHLYEVTKVTDEMSVNESVNEIKAALNLGTVSTPTIVRLVTTYDVNVSVELPENAKSLVWNQDNLALTITPTADQIVEVVKVTVTKGEKTQTFEVSVKSQIVKETTVTEALTLADGILVSFEATVSEINTAFDSKYGNMSVTVTDGTNSIYLYRVKANLTVGNKVVINGVIGSHNGSKQIASGATAEIVGSLVQISQIANIKDGAEIVVAGKVKSIDTEWSDQYNNISVVITDGTNDILVYRCKTNLVVGNEVVITGKVGSYNGKKQIAAGSTANLVSADHEALTIETTVYDSIVLPTVGKVNASAITWVVTEGEAIVIEDGVITVTQPAAGLEDATVKLTATITAAGASITKEFTVTVKAIPEDPNKALVAADKAALELENTTVTENFTLPTEGSVNASAITWAVTEGEAIVIEGANATVVRPSYSDGDATVVLTATITKGEIVDTKEFTLTVSKVEYNTHAEYVAAAVNTELTIQAVVVFKAGSYINLQDKEGKSYFIYGNVTNADVVVGNEIKFKATKANYNGLNQLTFKELIEVVSEGNVIEPKDVTEELTNSGLTVTGENQAMYVTLTAKVKSVSGRSVKLLLGTREISFYDQTKNMPSFVVAGATVKFTGTYAVNYENSQICVYDVAGYEDATPDTDKVQIALDHLLTLFNEKYIQTTTVKLSPLYSDVVVSVTLNGTTTLAWDATTNTLTVTPGQELVEETLVVKVELNGISKESEEVTISSQIEAVQTASLSFANKAQRTEYSTSKQVWVQNGITLTNDKAASTSNVADYANPARFYASSKLTIAVEGNITEIVFTCNSSSYATALKNSITGATVTVSGSKVTVTLDGTSSTFVIAKLSAQVRVNSLTVTYK